MRKGLWLVALAVVLAACGDGDGDSAVTRAEAKVTSKEEALSEAQSEADEAAAAFCGDSKSYIVALDRYGDVLSSTAPTVGDVNEAGADLAEPSDDATKAAESAVEAQEKVSEAERELAEARTALEQIQPSSGRPDTPSATESESPTSPPPMPPTETVDRVKQAEVQFESAQAGISDQTPLVQASQQFNAAAVALEMSWLRLYSDAGCLTKEQQKQAQAAVSDYTRTLQEALSEAGYYQGEVDGVYGPETVDAVEALQEVPRTAGHRHPGHGHSRGPGVRPPGQGWRRRSGGDRLDGRGPTDTEVGRVLGRTGRWGLDARADRCVEVLPDRTGRGSVRHRRCGHGGCLRAGDRRRPATGADTPC